MRWEEFWYSRLLTFKEGEIEIVWDSQILRKLWANGLYHHWERQHLIDLSAKLVRAGQDVNEKELEELEAISSERSEQFGVFGSRHNFKGADGWFLPEHWNYERVLSNIEADDVVLDLGAGNLALDILISLRALKVYAVEVNPEVVKDALAIIGYDLPRNLIVICANALDMPIPEDVNTLVALMRHFSHEIPESWLSVPKLIHNIGGEFRVTRREP